MRPADLPIGIRPNRVPPAARVEVIRQILMFGVGWDYIRGKSWLNEQQENSPKSKIQSPRSKTKNAAVFVWDL
jgi:hypothetical protein